VKLVIAFVAIGVLAAGAMGCTMTQKIASGAAVGGVTGFALGGPIGAGVGGAAGALAVPVAMSD
jgi:osmotically inducible lipoprotein OsmB